MKEKIKEQLDNLVGKTFNYQGSNITIERYKIVGVSNVVIFIPRPKNLLISEIPEFLENLNPPTEKPLQIAIPHEKVKVFEPTKENDTVKETLLETLEKVKSNPDYIPQAQAVCNVVSKIVSVQKTEIQMLQLLKSKK